MLNDVPWRLLQGLCWYYTVPYNPRQPRRTLAERLRAALIQPRLLDEMLANLSKATRQLLAGLVAQGGLLQAEHLFALGGEVRPASYQRLVDAPWREPQTSSEALVYRGLLVVVPDAEPACYAIPADLLLPLQERLCPPPLLAPLEITEHPPDGVPPATAPTLAPAEALRHDLVLLLLHLQVQCPPVLAGGRLSIQTVRTLGACLSTPEDYQTIRSHRAASRLWFLTTLTQQAGLVQAAPASQWNVTVKGLAWLQQPAAQQLQQLYEAWQPGAEHPWSPESWSETWRDLWEVPPDLRQRLQTWLTALPPSEWVRRTVWEQHPHRLPLLVPTPVGQVVALAQRDLPRVQHYFLDQLLPALGMLGLLEVHTEMEAVRLTPLGAAWVQGTELSLTSEEMASWQRVGEELITPWPADPIALWRLAPFARLQAGGPHLRWEFTPQTVAAGLSQDIPLTTLRRALESGGLSLPIDILPLQPAPLLSTQPWLETATPMQMEQLRADPAVRRALVGGRTLSPRQHTLLPSHLPALERALTALGQPPRREGPHPVDEPSPQQPGPSALLLLAARLWQREIARLEAPIASPAPAPFLPAILLRELEASLTPVELDTANQLWQDILPCLARSEGGPIPIGAGPAPAPTLPPPEPPPPVEVLLSLLQGAIHRATPVHICYQAADQKITERVIAPCSLEEKYGSWYLGAFCHKDQDERTFRLDRILSLRPVDLP